MYGFKTDEIPEPFSGRLGAFPEKNE